MRSWRWDDDRYSVPTDPPSPLTLILREPTCDAFAAALERYIDFAREGFAIRTGIGYITERESRRAEWDAPDTDSRHRSWLYMITVTALVVRDPSPEFSGYSREEQRAGALEEPEDEVEERDEDNFGVYHFQVAPRTGPDDPGCLVIIEVPLPGLRPALDNLLHAVALAWPEAEEQLREQGALPTNRGVALDEPLSGDAPTDPWERIPDRRWHRKALKLWWEGNTVPEIARKVDRAEKTVRSVLSDLRGNHGKKIVPTADQLRRWGIR